MCIRDSGCTVCAGVISHELNGEDIIAVPREVDDRMEVGIVTRRDTHPLSLIHI